MGEGERGHRKRCSLPLPKNGCKITNVCVSCQISGCKMSEMGGMLNFIFEKRAFFFANCQV